MSKGLEAYEIVKEECGYTFGGTANGDRVRKNLPIIEKELKALEIIKNKNVNVLLLKSSSLENYNYCLVLEKLKLTQEEYDLLKEIL